MNKHVNETCKGRDCSTNQCSKIHSRICRKYNSNSGCRFNRDCTYKHVAEHQSNNIQNEINEAVANVTIRHEKEIKVIKAKIDKLRNAIETMDSNIESLLKYMEQNMCTLIILKSQKKI